jgi:predicted DNA-binding ribbon-helix-helix protein
MRRLFIEPDTRLWVNPTRSARIQGMVTSVRLEISFWEILADLPRLKCAPQDIIHCKFPEA